jgi:hypothetical protein
LTQLQNLDLNGTRVTDAGLEHLQRLKQLRDLHIIGTACTADGEEKFKQALPHCAIFGRHLLEPMDPGSLP